MTDPTFQPLYGQIVIRPIRRASTRGGIILPEKSRTDAGLPLARIIAIGPGRLNNDGDNVPSRYEVGQVVIPGGAPCPPGIDPATHNGTRGGFQWPMTEARKLELVEEYQVPEAEREEVMSGLTREQYYILYEEDIVAVVHNPGSLLVGCIEGLSVEEIQEHGKLMEAGRKLVGAGNAPVVALGPKQRGN